MLLQLLDRGQKADNCLFLAQLQFFSEFDKKTINKLITLSDMTIVIMILGSFKDNY